MLIDFTELELDHDFEKFSQIFLQKLGFNVNRIAAVGQDGGVDLICEEVNRYGNIGYRWLVSCKHYAKSRKSIGKSIDQADVNTLNEFRCRLNKPCMFVDIRNHHEKKTLTCTIC